MASLTDEILTIAAVTETVVLLPVLLEFLADRRKRRERVTLSLEEMAVTDISGDLAGLDDLLADIKDLIDRARHPQAYAELRVGNEILIVGPPLSGKKALARRIARDAQFQRLIIVHNPRDGDALAKAKERVRHARREKIMLLLPRLDLLNDQDDEELLTELDALIETTAGRDNVLVIGTASIYRPGSEVDNFFGIVLKLPGAPIAALPPLAMGEDVRHMLSQVAEFYLARILNAGYRLTDISSGELVGRLLRSVINPAQIEDIIVLCQTAAVYRRRQKLTDTRDITKAILESAIKRVVA